AHVEGALVRIAGARTADRLELTRRRAAVARGRVAVVALLGADDSAVAAHCETGRRTSRARPSVFDATGAVAAIARDEIPVVARLESGDGAIAATRRTRRRRVAAGEARLDLAGRVTAVAGDGAAVVACFARLDDAVAAGGGVAVVAQRHHVEI